MRYPKMKLLIAIALCGLAGDGWAQTTSPVLHGAEAASVAVNDDDWRVEIVPPFALPSRELGYHGGPVVERPTAVLVFMGEGWAAARVAEVQSAFVGDMPGVGRLARYGVRANPSVTTQRATIWTPENGFSRQGGLTDLEIQAQLERIPSAPNAKDTVYVLFLPDSLAAFLGDKLGGGDFLAYHNQFASRDGGQLRYVVVPFRHEGAQLAQAALRSFVQAVINPDGTGWY
jgi:hypothetical protein